MCYEETEQADLAYDGNHLSKRQNFLTLYTSKSRNLHVLNSERLFFGGIKELTNNNCIKMGKQKKTAFM
jgi:hypothetical protein